MHELQNRFYRNVSIDSLRNGCGFRGIHETHFGSHWSMQWKVE